MYNWFEANQRYLNINYKSKTKRIGFKKWLNRFAQEESIVGDFAVDVLRDDHFPHYHADKETCRAYLDNASFLVGNNAKIMELFEMLWDDYESKKRRSIPPSLRFKILERDEFKCVACGKGKKEGLTLEIDHINPVANHGKNEETNLQTLCNLCNRGKGAKH